MELLKNPHRGSSALAPQAPMPPDDANQPKGFFSLCPAAAPTPLSKMNNAFDNGELWLKDERKRLGLGSFKALGAAYLIARHACDTAGANIPDETTLTGKTYITASAGNHGLSVAAGARLFGAKAVVYLPLSAPESFKTLLRRKNAKVLSKGHTYDEALKAAKNAANAGKGLLISDTSWNTYLEIPRRVMEGYLIMADEMVQQAPKPPTHLVLQAGVGGMAGALARFARKHWGEAVRIIVVEPTAAPALQASIRAGRPIRADGPVSTMGRLDCKEPSLIALNGLAKDADAFLTLSDQDVESILPRLEKNGFKTTPSGAAGAAVALLDEARELCNIGDGSRTLAVISERSLP